jgi:nascent polypeptide-associated complex subunit alpha
MFSFKMFGGMNPAKIQGMMKKMGISQTPLNVKRVIFEKEEGNLVIDEPSVVKIMMQGQESYQITGEAREETKEIFSEEDVKMVIEKTGKSEEEVRVALEETEGDIAEAIINLK